MGNHRRDDEDEQQEQEEEEEEEEEEQEDDDDEGDEEGQDGEQEEQGRQGQGRRVRLAKKKQDGATTSSGGAIGSCREEQHQVLQGDEEQTERKSLQDAKQSEQLQEGQEAPKEMVTP